MPSSAAFWVYLVSVLAPVVAGIVLAFHYPSLPAVIPVHFDAAGEPDGFADKSWPMVLMMPVMALVVVGLFVLLEVLRRRSWGPQPVLDGAERAVPVPFSESAQARAQYSLAVTGRWLAWLGAVVSLGMSGLAVAGPVPEYRGLFVPALVLLLIGTVVIMVVGLVLSFRAQATAREKFPPDAQEQERDRVLSGGQAQRQVYRFGGLIYSNPADPMALSPSYMSSGNIDLNLSHAPGQSFYRFLAVFLVALALLPVGLSLL